MSKIVRILDDKKAIDIDVLNLENVSLLSDYFIICSGNSKIQMKALADEITEKLFELGYQPFNKEGYANEQWILIDYGQVVIHIFSHESRSFYNLERLWSDAYRIDVEEIINEGRK